MIDIYVYIYTYIYIFSIYYIYVLTAIKAHMYMCVYITNIFISMCIHSGMYEMYLPLSTKASLSYFFWEHEP